jgi:hypothetical protein
MARPTKYNETRTDAILTALRAGNTRKAAVAYAGVDYVTFLRWCERYASFAEAVEKAEADAEVRHVANIAKAAGEGTWTASAWWLERRRHKDWGQKARLDVVVKQLAEQTGLKEDEIVAEAERLLAGTR